MNCSSVGYSDVQSVIFLLQCHNEAKGWVNIVASNQSLRLTAGVYYRLNCDAVGRNPFDEPKPLIPVYGTRPSIAFTQTLHCRRLPLRE